VLHSSFGGGVWEHRHVADGVGRVLDFDVAAPIRLGGEQQIDAAGAAVRHLAAHGGVAGQLVHHPSGDGFGHDRVGQRRVDVDPGWADPHCLKGEPELAARVARITQPDATPGFQAAQQAAGVGTVGHHDLAVVRLDLGEEPLVTAEQTPLHHGLYELHARGPYGLRSG
jgi:hypothetical protein